VRLEDGDIALRPLGEEDVPALVDALRDSETIRWLPVPSPYTETDAQEFVRKAPNVSAVEDTRTGEFLGTIGWRWVDKNVQLGYWVKREARGRGIATRALSLLSRWALQELGAQRVQLVAEPENVASQRVAEKAGFRREATLQAYLEVRGERRDAVMFRLLPTDLGQPGPPRATTRLRA
jgi:RimJ/RimL family protein N-acetyltransferase